MREKLEWLTLLIPGSILALLIVVSMIGKGPVLEEIPKKNKANDIFTEVLKEVQKSCR